MKPLLTSKEVQKRLQISGSKLGNLCRSRQISFVKIGGSIRFRESDIDEYIENGYRPANNKSPESNQTGGNNE